MPGCRRADLDAVLVVVRDQVARHLAVLTGASDRDAVLAAVYRDVVAALEPVDVLHPGLVTGSRVVDAVRVPLVRTDEHVPVVADVRGDRVRCAEITDRLPGYTADVGICARRVVPAVVARRHVIGGTEPGDRADLDAVGLPVGADVVIDEDVLAVGAHPDTGDNAVEGDTLDPRPLDVVVERDAVGRGAGHRPAADADLSSTHLVGEQPELGRVAEVVVHVQRRERTVVDL